MQLALAVVLVMWTTSARAAADSLPYTVRVAAPGAAVHSGPGDNFYSTDTLAQGDVVEVHREQPDGWLGIRPPEGSFSWLFGLHVKPLEHGLAEVNKDDVASRIGSRLSDERNAVQVRLKKGETVEIIAEESVEGKKWYKVAPPAGEFRWIHATNVERVTVTPPAARQPIVTVPLPDTSAEPRDSTEPADAAVTLASDSQPQAEANWRAAPVEPKNESAKSAPIDSPADATKAAVVEPTTQPAEGTTASAASPPMPTPASTGPATVAVPVNAPPAQTAAPLSNSNDLSRQLTGIELRLSRIVAEPPVTWQIEPLRQETQQLLSDASDPASRAAISATLAKLDRFAAIASQYRQQTPIAASTGQPPITPIPYGAGSGDPRTAVPPDTQHPTPDTSNYDAVGVLRPVVSKRPGAPQFALVDERGQVISFVTPTPDINLQPYLGHRIGITGNRGYIPEFQRAHVTAGRVSPLGARMVR
jgi:SH3-like domain-containing protein